jgi:hypothetical protein
MAKVTLENIGSGYQSTSTANSNNNILEKSQLLMGSLLHEHK